MPRLPVPGVNTQGEPRWVDVRDLATLRHRDKRRFTAATGAAYAEGDLGDGMAAGVDEAISILVTGWNLTDGAGNPLPIPSAQAKGAASVLDDLDLDVSDVLTSAAQEAIGRFSGRDVTAKDQDPAGPTVPSAG